MANPAINTNPACESRIFYNPLIYRVAYIVSTMTEVILSSYSTLDGRIAIVFFVLALKKMIRSYARRIIASVKTPLRWPFSVCQKPTHMTSSGMGSLIPSDFPISRVFSASPNPTRSDFWINGRTVFINGFPKFFSCIHYMKS